MNLNPIAETHQFGQSIWYDDLSRELLQSGRLARMVEADGLSGVTSNPAIFEKSISGSGCYDLPIAVLAEQGCSAASIYEHLAIEDVQGAADILRPVYHRSAGADGFVSLEVSPELAHDTVATIREAHRLAKAVERPNLMIKVPATAEGIAALEVLIGDGINVNATLLFSVDVYRQVARAYMNGLERYADSGRHLSHPASVASFFLSRIDTAVDAELERKLTEAASMGVRDLLSGLLGRAAIANAKLAYDEFRATMHSPAWLHLQGRGARPQRLLWASTGTKNPAYPKLCYVEPLIGPDTVNTVPEQTYQEFLHHGRPRLRLTEDLDEAWKLMQQLELVDVSIKQITDKLLHDGLVLFGGAQKRLLAAIEGKCALADGSGAAAWHFQESKPLV